jgi:hypothetical protein
MNYSINTIIGLKAANYVAMKNALNLSPVSTNGISKPKGIQWSRTIWTGERGDYTGSAAARKGQPCPDVQPNVLQEATKQKPAFAFVLTL